VTHRNNFNYGVGGEVQPNLTGFLQSFDLLQMMSTSSFAAHFNNTLQSNLRVREPSHVADTGEYENSLNKTFSWGFCQHWNSGAWSQADVMLLIMASVHSSIQDKLKSSSWGVSPRYIRYIDSVFFSPGLTLCFACGNRKNWFLVMYWHWSSTGNALVGKKTVYVELGVIMSLYSPILTFMASKDTRARTVLLL